MSPSLFSRPPRSCFLYVVAKRRKPLTSLQATEVTIVETTAMAVTARSVVYTMVTSVACKAVRDFRCLAIKYTKTTSRAWRRLRRLKNCLRRRLRARIPLEIDFEPILDPILGRILSSKSSSEVEFKEAHASNIAFGGGFGRGYPSRSILDQFWT